MSTAIHWDDIPENKNEDIHIGDSFVWDGEVYMRTDFDPPRPYVEGTFYAVNLSTGFTIIFNERGDLLQPVDLDIHLSRP